MEYTRVKPKDGRRLRISRNEFCLQLIILFFFCSHSSAAPVPIIRVMVDRERQGIKIEGFDLIIESADNKHQLAHQPKRASFSLKCSLGGQISVENPTSRSFRAIGPLHVSSLGGFIRVGTSQYRDDLYVYSFNKDCIVVNHVDLEKYVAGLLNSEMNANWHMPTLMAQAVAARTYAIYQMKESSTTRFRGLRAPFDLESTVKDQVYEGAHKERYRALRAVQETRGQILAYQGKPIKAFYHSTCGGHTESPEKVWGVKYPYLMPVNCGYCNRSPRFNWVYAVKPEEIERKLRHLKLVKGQLLSLRVAGRNRLGRADKIEVKGSLGSLVVPATHIRDILGTLNLRSTNFTIARDAAKYVFVGHGSGHGVGMCQWGAKAMGERGYSYAEILQHYYPMAKIAKLY